MDRPVAQAGSEELRLALVLNGGVSLAIWIGGVTHEVERLVNQDSAYGELLDLIHSTGRVDVISGTSAGGLNGALLALAITQDTRLDAVRDLWIDKGGLLSLMRDPFDGGLLSLLKGDDYFLVELQRTFRSLLNPSRDNMKTPREVPIDLSITTTLLDGDVNKLPDDYGTVITDVSHRGRFVFRRGPDTDTDPFADHGIADKLALAARSTASFPFAFEASFVPAKDNPRLNKPGMADHLEPRGDTDRWVIDGGVLDNKPIEGALQAIYRQRARGKVRRVLAYVVPDPGPRRAATSADAQSPPSPSQVVTDAVIKLPGNESVSEQLHEIREHNRRVREARAAKVSLTSRLRSGELDDMSRRLLPVYAEIRKQTSINYIVELVRGAVASSEGAGTPFRGRGDWLRMQLADADLPWVPRVPALDENWSADPHADPWRWGTRAIENTANIVIDVLRRTQQLFTLEADARGELEILWDLSFDALTELARIRSTDRRFWESQAAALSNRGPIAAAGDEQGSVEWVNSVLAEWQTAAYEPSRGLLLPAPPGLTISAAAYWVGLNFAFILSAARGLIDDVTDDVSRYQVAPLTDDVAELLSLVEYLTPLPDSDDVTPNPVPLLTLQRLLALHTVSAGLGQRTTVGQEVDFIQVSAETPSSFGGPSTPDTKLAGIQLGHFGAFYRRSWRANDWLHGRLDGTRRLVQICLAPDRLRALYGRRTTAGSSAPDVRPSEQVADWIQSIALGATNPDAVDALRSYFDRARVLAELDYLDSPQTVPPETLPACVDAVARRLQLATLRRDLVAVYQAAKTDIEQGAATSGESYDFTKAFEREMGGEASAVREVPPRAAVRLFQNLAIGEEDLKADGSDLFMDTSSRALAVTASIGYEDQLPGFLRRVTGFIRGPLLLLYLLVKNATAGRGGAVVNTALLTFGAVVVGIDAFTTQSLPGLLVGFAWVAFIAGILLVLLRGGLGAAVAIGLALLAAVIGAVTIAFASDGSLADWFVDRAPQAVAIIGLVVFLLVLGAIRINQKVEPNHMPEPDKWVHDLMKK